MAKNSGNTRKKNSENIKEAQISSNLRATYGDSWNINNFIKASPYFDEETVYENFKEKYAQQNPAYGLSQEMDDVDKTFKDLGEDKEIDMTKIDISTPQEFLNISDTAKYMNTQKYNGIKAVSYNMNGKNKLMIVDGNHRFVAAKFNGVKKVKMRVITI